MALQGAIRVFTDIKFLAELHALRSERLNHSNKRRSEIKLKQKRGILIVEAVWKPYGKGRRRPKYTKWVYGRSWAARDRGKDDVGCLPHQAQCTIAVDPSNWKCWVKQIPAEPGYDREGIKYYKAAWSCAYPKYEKKNYKA
ncbi:hypothetical protein B0H14DRAFT_2568059 [Mycena olivaceomarginata]|nr:hypothetical protein B0H14DRAFT_2568059 [Mycena olivaceomarginata]